MEILTPRLRLRPPCEDDLAALHAIFTDAQAMRFWSTPPHTDLEQSRAWLAGMMASPPDESFDFIVEREGRLIGKAGCWRLPEIGYILHPDAWGQGFASEALGAIIPQLFARFPIPSITADVDPRNGASLKLLARLGFVETGRATGTIQVGDELCDSVYLALEKPVPRLP